MTTTDTDTVGLRRPGSPEHRPSAQTYIEAAQAEIHDGPIRQDVAHFLSWGGRVLPPGNGHGVLGEDLQRPVATIERRTIALHKAHTDSRVRVADQTPDGETYLTGFDTLKATRRNCQKR